MKKIFICLFIIIASNSCTSDVQKNEKDNNKFNLPVGNRIISSNDSNINKITIDSLQIEYDQFYNSITTPISDNLKNIELPLKDSYYFSKEENVFFDFLKPNNIVCCMELIIQNDVNFKIYLIKTNPSSMEISEWHGYKNELFLVSVSEKNKKIIDVINIYNDGIMLYWECIRFFYIDADLNICLKDYSINEGDYKCINYQNFSFTADGYFKRNDILSQNATIINDSIKDFAWKGTYNFNQTFLRYMDESEFQYSIKIINSESASLINKVNNKTDKYSADIISFNNDSLVLNYIDKNNDKKQIILYDTDKGYKIGGKTIYLLNPPNEVYPIIKE